jgi:hypothetical protein
MLSRIRLRLLVILRIMGGDFLPVDVPPAIPNRFVIYFQVRRRFASRTVLFDLLHDPTVRDLLPLSRAIPYFKIIRFGVFFNCGP